MASMELDELISFERLVTLVQPFPQLIPSPIVAPGSDGSHRPSRWFLGGGLHRPRALAGGHRAVPDQAGKLQQLVVWGFWVGG